jgi:hypothetical protein
MGYERLHTGPMDTRQFVVAMAGHLAWPFTALILGFLFRRALTGLIGRVLHFSIGDFDAELAAENDVDQAVQDAAQHHLDRWGELGDEQKDRIEHVIQEAVTFGFTYGRHPEHTSPPVMKVAWQGDRPSVHAKRTLSERRFLLRLKGRITKIEEGLSSGGRSPEQDT